MPHGERCFQTFEKVQAILRDYPRVNDRGVPRDGAALLHGITWCGECGHKLALRYLFAIEREINGLAPQERLRVRQEGSRALIVELEAWLREQRTRLSRSNDTTKAINYCLNRWSAFTRFLDDGRLCMPNNAAEREHASIDPRLRAKVVALAARLPAIWADPATPREAVEPHTPQGTGAAQRRKNSRRLDPIGRFGKPFCHGEADAVGLLAGIKATRQFKQAPATRYTFSRGVDMFQGMNVLLPNVSFKIPGLPV